MGIEVTVPRVRTGHAHFGEDVASERPGSREHHGRGDRHGLDHARQLLALPAGPGAPRRHNPVYRANFGYYVRVYPTVGGTRRVRTRSSGARSAERRSALVRDPRKHAAAYWRERSHEVDYIVRTPRLTWAVEVKSGRDRGAPGLAASTKKCPEARPLIVGSGGIPLEEFFRSDPVDVFKA